MCGITGIVTNSNRPVDITVLAAMTDSLVHRGPDDRGVQCLSGPDSSGLHAGLGHRRLSIIDLSALGHQPMTNEDRTIWISFNGEIYNFRELRTDLIRKGHHFTSETDTEVIIHGYETYGADICSKIKGMFVFALWDCNKGSLLLARDRFGKKPLYYSMTENSLVFASELKALRQCPDMSLSLDMSSLSLYLAYEYVPVPLSIYKNVQKLPPGTYLIYNGGNEPSINQYWNISFINT